MVIDHTSTQDSALASTYTCIRAQSASFSALTHETCFYKLESVCTGNGENRETLLFPDAVENGRLIIIAIT